VIILKIKQTFRESFRHGNTIFEAGESLTVLYLGGGDLLRFEWDGRRFEIPSSVVRQEIMR
jgi:hypothetical protein